MITVAEALDETQTPNRDPNPFWDKRPTTTPPLATLWRCCRETIVLRLMLPDRPRWRPHRKTPSQFLVAKHVRAQAVRGKIVRHPSPGGRESQVAELGYARVSTTHQDLDRQLDALTAHGIPSERTWQDKKTGATVNHPGFTELRRYARPGDTIVATNLDRIGRNLRECLNLAYELREQKVGIKTLCDPIPIDTSDDSPMAQIAVAMLALFAEMERTFARERAAHARAVALEKGKLPGRPRKLDNHKLQAARASIDAGMHINDLADLLNIHRATLYRALQRDQPAN